MRTLIVSIRSTAGPLIACAFLGMLVLRVDGYTGTFLADKGIDDRDVLSRVFGGMRTALSNYSFLQADEYLHGGVLPKDHSECDTIGHEEADHDGGMREGHHHHHDAPASGRVVPRGRWLPLLGDRIAIGRHIHLEGAEERELLPWFAYAVRLDPHNVQAYVIGGYFLGVRLGRTEEAIAFLRQGLRDNPAAWQICQQMGEIRFGKKVYGDALVYFLMAQDRIDRAEADGFERREIASFIGGCYERLHDPLHAIESYRRVLAWFPEDERILNKIAELTAAQEQPQGVGTEGR